MLNFRLAEVESFYACDFHCLKRNDTVRCVLCARLED